MRKTNISLSEDVHKRLRREAADTYESMSEIVTKALQEYFQKGGKRKE